MEMNFNEVLSLCQGVIGSLALTLQLQGGAATFRLGH